MVVGFDSCEVEADFVFRRVLTGSRWRALKDLSGDESGGGCEARSDFCQ